MNGNPKNQPNETQYHPNVAENTPVLVYLNALSLKYKNHPEIVSLLESIEEKLKFVSNSVAYTLLQHQLDQLRSSDSSSLAAVLATNDHQFLDAA